ncbi:MAG: GGDEF domain-containing protein, partial [Sneathiella sp.]
AEREQIRITIVMIDLDLFKAVNDTYGHEAGDEVLREVSAGLKARTRESDVLARIGGEEFCLLAINVDPKFQESFLNDILETIASIKFNFDGKDVSVSASMGVTTELGTSLDDMMVRADNALYKAKEQGRARFILAE